MPYIKKDRREALRHVDAPETEGELNYVITLICQNYLKRKGLNYGNINAVVGALECAKLEAYRRIASPYEDKKIAENGDVMEIT